MLSLLLFAASAGLRLRGADGECTSGSTRPACLCDRCLGLTTDQRKYVTRTADWVACLDQPSFAVGAEEATGPVGSRCAPETVGRLATVDYVPVIVGSACVPAVQAQFMAGVEGAGEMAGFAVAFEAPTGERACHGQNVFKVVMRVQPLPNDSGPDLELTMVIGEREYVADGLYFVDMRSLGPAPTTHNVNVTVVPIFAHCQHTGAAYDHALEMSGCAKSTAPPVAATIMPWGAAAAVSSPLPRCGRTSLADEGGLWVTAASCNTVVGGAPICRPGEPSPALALQHTNNMDQVFVPPRCRYQLFDVDAVIACLKGKKVLVVGDSTVHGIWTEMQLVVANSTDYSEMVGICQRLGNGMKTVRGSHGIDYYPNHIPFRYGLSHFRSQFERAENTFLQYDFILFGSLAHDISYTKGFACGHTNLTADCLEQLRGSWRLKPLLEYRKNVRLTAEWFLRLRAKKPSLSIMWILATHSMPPMNEVEIGNDLAIYPQERNNLFKAGNDVARSIMKQAGFDVLDAEKLSSMGRSSWWSNGIHFHFCHSALSNALLSPAARKRNFSGGVGRMIAHAYLGAVCP